MKQLRANDVTSTGHGMGITFELGGTVYAGYKAMVGKGVQVEFTPHSLAFVLTGIAQRYPDAIRAMADALGDHEYREGRYDYELSRALQSAAEDNLEG
jgi:hypothetical protein